MKKLLLLILLLSLSGCGANPTGPTPPVLHQQASFEAHQASLQTPGHVYFWIKNFSTYDSGKDWEYNRNWYEWESKKDENGNPFPDQAYAVAWELYHNYARGENRGQCGQFACTYAAALRTHGYRCGVLLMYNPGSGHAQGWVEERNGTVSITDNQTYCQSVYPSYEAFLQSCRDRIAQCRKQNKESNTNAYAFWLCNEKAEIVMDETGEHFDRPSPLNN